MIHIIKNIAGKDRFVLSITGIIVVVIIAWIAGLIFMPKAADSTKHKLEGNWIAPKSAGYFRMNIKSSGYFYVDISTDRSKVKSYTGFMDKYVTDTIAAISFNNDTLLFHKIISISKQQLVVRSLFDSAIIRFSKR